MMESGIKMCDQDLKMHWTLNMSWWLIGGGGTAPEPNKKFLYGVFEEKKLKQEVEISTSGH